MSDQATLEAPAAPDIETGPLIPVYEQAKTNGTLAIGTFDHFVEAAGIPLVGAAGQVVALIAEGKTTSLKVAGKLAAFHRSPSSPLPQFEGGEHTFIGDSIKLYFFADDQGTPASQVPLTVQTDLELTYGQILALGGDFYGCPDAPISDGATQAARMALFQSAYETLSGHAHQVKEAKKILAIMQEEITAVQAALNAGQSPSTVYDALGDRLNKAWNKATGGGSFISDLIPMGRYLELATTNWDHFGQYAVMAYQAGHAVALNQALVAYNTPNPSEAEQILSGAYAMNAFADHFLSDLFSSGHIRDPRKEIYATAWVGVTANLCAKGMHDEDSKYGLMVANANGDTWRAYGDKQYFETYNLENQYMVDIAVQVSADEIFATFLTGQMPQDPSMYEALSYAPNITQVQDYQNNPLGNFSPMFVLDGGSVQCRADLNNLNLHQWSSIWTTGDVASYLHSSHYQPNQPTAYIAPPTTAPAISPTGWNATQPIPPNWVSGGQVRYFVSFASADYESKVGPPCAYYTLSNQFEPSLTNIPLGPAGVTSRVIYREFLGSPIELCGKIADNTTTTFADTTP